MILKHLIKVHEKVLFLENNLFATEKSRFCNHSLMIFQFGFFVRRTLFFKNNSFLSSLIIDFGVDDSESIIGFTKLSIPVLVQIPIPIPIPPQIPHWYCYIPIDSIPRSFWRRRIFFIHALFQEMFVHQLKRYLHEMVLQFAQKHATLSSVLG